MGETDTFPSRAASWLKTRRWLIRLMELTREVVMEKAGISISISKAAFRADQMEEWKMLV